jgi:transcriptional regulator with XRE-family HTH domain
MRKHMGNNMQLSKHNKYFIENVERILKQRERNYSWLCDKSGLDSATISRILRGMVTPSFQALEAISEALEVQLPWMLSEHRPNTKAPDKDDRGIEKDELDDLYLKLELIEKKLDVVMAQSNSTIRVSKKI